MIDDVLAQAGYFCQLILVDIDNVVLLVLFVGCKQKGFCQISFGCESCGTTHFILFFGQIADTATEVIDQLVPKFLVGQFIIAHFIVHVGRCVFVNPREELETELHVHVDVSAQETQLGKALVAQRIFIGGQCLYSSHGIVYPAYSDVMYPPQVV